MAEYRCYFLDGQNHILRVETIDAPGDTEALAGAHLLYRGRSQYAYIEVFTGSRLVERRVPAP